MPDSGAPKANSRRIPPNEACGVVETKKRRPPTAPPTMLGRSRHQLHRRTVGESHRAHLGRAVGVVVFASLVLLAGSSSVAARVSERELAPLWSAALRFGLAALVFWAAAIFRRLPPPTWAMVKSASVLGILNVGLGSTLVYWGLQSVPVVLVQTLTALVPLLTQLLARLHGIEILRLRTLLGAITGVVGVIIVLGRPGAMIGTPAALLAVFGAVLCTSESFVMVKVLPSVEPVTTNAVAMTMGAAMLVALSALFGEARVVPHTPTGVVALLFNVIFGSVLLFWLYLWLLKTWPVTSLSYVFLLAPLATLAVAAFVGEAQVTIGLLVGGAVVIGGVYVGITAAAPLATPRAEET